MKADCGYFPAWVAEEGGPMASMDEAELRAWMVIAAYTPVPGGSSEVTLNSLSHRTRIPMDLIGGVIESLTSQGILEEQPTDEPRYAYTLAKDKPTTES